MKIIFIKVKVFSLTTCLGEKFKALSYNLKVFIQVDFYVLVYMDLKVGETKAKAINLVFCISLCLLFLFFLLRFKFYLCVWTFALILVLTLKLPETSILVEILAPVSKHDTRPNACGFIFQGLVVLWKTFSKWNMKISKQDLGQNEIFGNMRTKLNKYKSWRKKIGFKVELYDIIINLITLGISLSFRVNFVLHSFFPSKMFQWLISKAICRKGVFFCAGLRFYFILRPWLLSFSCMSHKCELKYYSSSFLSFFVIILLPSYPHIVGSIFAYPFLIFNHFCYNFLIFNHVPSWSSCFWVK